MRAIQQFLACPSSRRRPAEHPQAGLNASEAALEERRQSASHLLGRAAGRLFGVVIMCDAGISKPASLPEVGGVVLAAHPLDAAQCRAVGLGSTLDA
jgi:hypothetical protein